MDQKLTPVERSLAANRACPHNMGKCGAPPTHFQMVNHANLVCDRFIIFTCQSGHTWQDPVVED